MKRLVILLTLAVFFVAASASAQIAPAGKGKPNPGPKPPTVFSDDFDDGNTDGWIFTDGNWQVDANGALEKPLISVSDYQFIYVDNLDVGSASIEVMLNPRRDGGGVVFWRQDWGEQVEVWLSYYHQTLWIAEVHDNVLSGYDYGGEWEPEAWYKLRIDADSRTGKVKVWVNDVFMFTYTVRTPHRSGIVGLHSASHGYGSAFDDFIRR